jgi:hypothetical protein
MTRRRAQSHQTNVLVTWHGCVSIPAFRSTGRHIGQATHQEQVRCPCELGRAGRFGQARTYTSLHDICAQNVTIVVGVG